MAELARGTPPFIKSKVRHVRGAEFVKKTGVASEEGQRRGVAEGNGCIYFEVKGDFTVPVTPRFFGGRNVGGSQVLERKIRLF